MDKNELTWQGIRCIVNIADQMVDEDEDGRLLTMSEEDYYKEVLARFIGTNKREPKPAPVKPIIDCNL